MKWHYGVGNQMLGPVEDEDLLKLVRNGTIGPETLIWASFLPEWTPAKNVKGLFKKAGIQLPAEEKPADNPKISHKAPNPRSDKKSPPFGSADAPQINRGTTPLPSKKQDPPFSSQPAINVFKSRAAQDPPSAPKEASDRFGSPLLPEKKSDTQPPSAPSPCRR